MAFKLNLTTIVILVVVGVLIFKPDVLSGLGGSGSGDVADKIVVNPTPTAKTLTINMKNKHNLGTTVTGDTIRSYVDGTLKASSTVSGGTITVDEGDKVVLYGADNSTTYYTKKKEYTVGKDLQQIVELHLCQIDTSVSMQWYNEDDTAATNVTVGTGGAESFDLRLKASADTCYGNPDIPKSAGVGIKYNTTAWTTMDMNGADIVTCPNSLTAASGFDWECYEMDTLEDGNEAYFRDQVDLQAGGSVNPTGATLYDLTVQMIDKDYDFNARTDAEIAGFEDEDRNDLGDTTTQTLTVGFI